jgi:hypothetical protein
MFDFIPGVAIIAVIAACVRSVVSRPPIVEIDEDDMKEFIQQDAWTTKTITTYYTEPKQAAKSYYDVYRRMTESTGNNN